MEIIGYILVTLLSSFFLVWGISSALAAGSTPKGTSKRLLLEVFTLFIINIAFITQGLYIALVLG